MKKSFLSFVVLALANSTSLAYNTTFDYCDKLPGKWQAATHIKDKSNCDGFNGCEHFDLVTFKYTDKNDYSATLFYSNDGKEITVQSFAFSCRDNQFRFDNPEGKTVNLQCDEFNNCYMVVDTPQFMVELVKQ